MTTKSKNDWARIINKDGMIIFSLSESEYNAITNLILVTREGAREESFNNGYKAGHAFGRGEAIEDAKIAFKQSVKDVIGYDIDKEIEKARKEGLKEGYENCEREDY